MTVRELYKLLEPAVQKELPLPEGATGDYLVALSIAVSLRRIADALEAEAKPDEPEAPPEKRPAPEFKLREAVVPKTGLLLKGIVASASLPHAGEIGMVMSVEHILIEGKLTAEVRVWFPSGDTYTYLPEYLRHATEAEARAAGPAFANAPLREDG